MSLLFRLRKKIVRNDIVLFGYLWKYKLFLCLHSEKTITTILLSNNKSALFKQIAHGHNMCSCVTVRGKVLLKCKYCFFQQLTGNVWQHVINLSHSSDQYVDSVMIHLCARVNEWAQLSSQDYSADPNRLQSVKLKEGGCHSWGGLI